MWSALHAPHAPPSELLDVRIGRRRRSESCSRDGAKIQLDGRADSRAEETPKALSGSTSSQGDNEDANVLDLLPRPGVVRGDPRHAELEVQRRRGQHTAQEGVGKRAFIVSRGLLGSFKSSAYSIERIIITFDAIASINLTTFFQ